MYEPHEIDISYKYLKTVVGRLEEPLQKFGRVKTSAKIHYLL